MPTHNLSASVSILFNYFKINASSIDIDFIVHLHKLNGLNFKYWQMYVDHFSYHESF